MEIPNDDPTPDDIEPGADLREADLSGARLYTADLSEADLKGTDLSEANLGSADLWNADLREADLSKAVNIRMTETFLEDVDGTWEELGYNSRSEFIRDVLRDAVKHPTFNRADLKAMLAGEVEIQEGRTHNSDDVKAAVGYDEAGDASDE